MILINKTDIKNVAGKIYTINLPEDSMTIEKVTNEDDVELLFAHNMGEFVMSVIIKDTDFNTLKIYTMNEEYEKQLELWDPDEAKRVGSLKGIAEFKTELDYKKAAIEFSEPKPKKRIQTVAKVVDIKSKNKNALF